MYVANEATSDLENASNPLMPLYGATHGLITQFRLLDEHIKQT